MKDQEKNREFTRTISMISDISCLENSDSVNGSNSDSALPPRLTVVDF